MFDIDILYKSPVTAAAMYIIAVIVVVYYVIFKYNNKRLFTIYNIGVYISIFTYLIITPFQFRNEAWYALGHQNASYFYPYLYKSITINFLGFIIYLLSDMYFEKKKKKSQTLNKMDIKIQSVFVYDVVCIVFTMFAAIYLYIVFAFNHGFPLFNGGRNFFYDSGIMSYIYQSAVNIINLSGLYFGLYAVNNKKSWLLFLVAAFLSISTGSRASFFTSIMYPLFLVIFYKKYKKISFVMIVKVVIAVILLIAGGIFIDFVRSGSTESTFNMMNNILYGNTFSDIRDGAYLFYGYENNWNSEIIFGKTYLAGIISFIPSYLSKFRQEWSFGRFSSYTLFHFVDHFGLRGGMAFEAYINFRIPGVILVAILNGYFLSIMEQSFSENIYNKIKSKEPINVNSIFFMKIISGIQGFITISSNSTSVYTLIVFILIIYVVKTVLPIRIKQRK